MKAILHNPYRVVGLLVGANAKEKERQVRRLKQYIEAEQEPEADDSFSEKVPVLRTIEAVSDAASKLNLDRDRMNAALFWFFDGNEVKDKMAFDAMKDGNFDQAEKIWTKLTSSEISKVNASAFSNLSTLYLSSFLNGSHQQEKLFEKGISLKLNFLESDYVREFKKKATDETYIVTSNELQLMFLHQVRDEVEKGHAGITLDMLLLIVMELSFSAKDEFLKNFIQKPTEQIERKIDETKNKRKANPANAVEASKLLLKETKESLSQLEFVLKTTDIRYTSITDSIAEEILQCGIDYFNYHREASEGSKKKSKDDFAKVALEICQKAASIAVGNKVKQRCKENVDGMKGYMEQRVLIVHIDKYKQLPQTIDQAKQFVTTAKPLLSSFKSFAGNNKELSKVYTDISTHIADIALGMCIEEINRLQENIGGNIDLFKRKTNDALGVMNLVEAMDLQPDFKNNRLKENKAALVGLKDAIERPAPGHADLEKLKEVIDRNGLYPQTVDNAKGFLSEAKPLLQKIKSALGANNDVYLALSTRVAADAQGMCVTEVNELLGQLERSYNKSREIEKLKVVVAAACLMLLDIGNMDLLKDFRSNFEQNKKNLYGLAEQLFPGAAKEYTSPKRATPKGPEKNPTPKCYIATMAYGDYDHPQVMVLRDFRDQRLDKYILGQWFIKVYYRYSPKLVEILQDKKTVNSIIRTILNQFIKLIK